MTVSPLGCERLKSRDFFFFFILIFPAARTMPGIWQAIKKSSWNEEKVIYINARSVDFPAYPCPWKHGNPTLTEMMTSARRGPKAPTKKRNLEMTPSFAAALSSAVVSVPDGTQAWVMGAYSP